MPKRRGHGEGSIYRRKDGRFCAQVTVGRDATGKLKRRYIYGRTRKEVQEQLTKVLAKKIDGLPIDASKQTVGEFLDAWLADTAGSSLRPTSLGRYERIVRLHLKPAIGHINLNKLTPQHVQRLYRSKQEEGFTATLDLCRAVLHRALDQATKWGFVGRNVTDLVGSPKVAKKEFRALSSEEARKFLAAAENDRLYALYVLAVMCGLREAELLGLRWEDVDLARGVLQVRHQLQWRKREDGGGKEPAWVLTPPKSSKGRRAIVLPAIARAALKKHKVRQTQDRLRAGDMWQDLGFVFTTEIGTPKDASRLRREFAAILKRAGLPKIRFHDLRHTAATLMLRAGVPLKVVSDTLGHSSIAITADRYAHALHEMKEEAAAKMDGLFSNLGTPCSGAQSDSNLTAMTAKPGGK